VAYPTGTCLGGANLNDRDLGQGEQQRETLEVECEHCMLIEGDTGEWAIDRRSARPYICGPAARKMGGSLGADLSTRFDTSSDHTVDLAALEAGRLGPGAWRSAGASEDDDLTIVIKRRGITREVQHCEGCRGSDQRRRDDDSTRARRLPRFARPDPHVGIGSRSCEHQRGNIAIVAVSCRPSVIMLGGVAPPGGRTLVRLYARAP